MIVLLPRAAGLENDEEITRGGAERLRNLSADCERSGSGRRQAVRLAVILPRSEP